MSYFDTAYLLKCYVKEHGWEAVRAFARGRQRIACSIHGRMELLAALHRKLREGELTEPHVTVVLRQLDLDESERLWEWIPLSSAIIEAVADTFRSLPRDVFLRTGDAVHLLSARAHGFTEIYSNDRHLLRAAPHFGLTGRDLIEPSAAPARS